MSKKTVVVTGGTKGIGRAILEEFAKNGFNIFTCARNEDDLSNLKDLIEKEHNVECHYQVADLSKKDDALLFGDFVLAHTDEVTVLVNNAGFFVPGAIHSEEDGMLEAMINTNLYSAYYLSRQLLPVMIEKKAGHVFNICSIASITAYPNGGSYSISKFALHGFTKNLREEMKDKGVKVTSVMPGATWSASWEGADVPQERLMKSSDIAASIWGAYELSDRAVVEELVIRPQLGDL